MKPITLEQYLNNITEVGFFGKAANWMENNNHLAWLKNCASNEKDFKTMKSIMERNIQYFFSEEYKNHWLGSVRFYRTVRQRFNEIMDLLGEQTPNFKSSIWNLMVFSEIMTCNITGHYFNYFDKLSEQFIGELESMFNLVELDDVKGESYEEKVDNINACYYGVAAPIIRFNALVIPRSHQSYENTPAVFNFEGNQICSAESLARAFTIGIERTVVNEETQESTTTGFIRPFDALVIMDLLKSQLEPNLNESSKKKKTKVRAEEVCSLNFTLGYALNSLLPKQYRLNNYILPNDDIKTICKELTNELKNEVFKMEVVKDDQKLLESLSSFIRNLKCSFDKNTMGIYFSLTSNFALQMTEAGAVNGTNLQTWMFRSFNPKSLPDPYSSVSSQLTKAIYQQKG